jgi:hypothetical protein
VGLYHCCYLRPLQHLPLLLLMVQHLLPLQNYCQVDLLLLLKVVQ